ncbi:hypothetical protein SDJN02_04486, partial [Cucurbita argyrosperma subsp. argyrosperma]
MWAYTPAFLKFSQLPGENLQVYIWIDHECTVFKPANNVKFRTVWDYHNGYSTAMKKFLMQWIPDVS